MQLHFLNRVGLEPLQMVIRTCLKCMRKHPIVIIPATAFIIISFAVYLMTSTSSTTVQVQTRCFEQIVYAVPCAACHAAAEVLASRSSATQAPLLHDSGGIKLPNHSFPLRPLWPTNLVNFLRTSSLGFSQSANALAVLDCSLYANAR